MSLTDDIALARKQDILLVLGGEDVVQQSRSAHAANIMHGIGSFEDARDDIPFILSTGGYGGRAQPGEVAHGQQITDRLIQRGVAPSRIVTETESLDTIANFVLSRPLIDTLTADRIGLVTDHWHMDRALSFGKYVLGPAYELTPIPSFLSRGGNAAWQEALIKGAAHLDWRTLTPVRRGDDQGFRRYLREQHVYHAEKPAVSFYRGVAALRNAESAVRQFFEP